MILLTSLQDLENNLWKITPQLTSIFLTTLMVCILSILYNKKIRNIKAGEQIGGGLVIVHWFIRVVEGQIISSVGRKKLYLTPYIMYIYIYILTSSIIACLGFESATTTYSVTLSMAFVTFIMIYFYGIKYQKFAFFKMYLNPIELISQFVPLISLSFRLFGNMIAGAIMLGLVYSLSIGITGALFTNLSGAEIKNAIWNIDGDSWQSQYKYFWTGFNVPSIIFLPFLHMYFDLFDGFLQSLVFANLSLSYWSEKMEVHEKPKKVKKVEEVAWLD